MENLKNDSGRSMVEMLGTLVIIGVLSVGAIVGYSYAMDKYRANRTMNDVRLRGMDVLAQFDATGTATLDGWKNEPTLYPISLEEGTIGIQVDNVPQRVCEMIAEGMEHSADIKFITSNEATTDCGDKTTMVFYFDDDLTEGEGNINEPVREQCGETLCEQCEVCDKDTMTCVSAFDKIAETADNVDDFRICASNGYKSYCGLLGDGCAELGSANCAGMGDPDCVAYIDGSCEPLDSTMYMQEGVGGFRCTKNGQDGYCYNGACRATGPAGEACIGKEDEEACEVNGQTGMCLYGVCMASCSNSMGTCDAFGAKGVCADGLCAPLTDDGCSVTFAGQTIPLPNEFAFACEKDSESGICLDGGCATEKCGDTYCGQCFECDESTMTCVSAFYKIAETADNVDDFRICASNGYQSYCGLLGNGCAIMGICGGDPECNVYASGECQPLDSSMYLTYGLGGFRCTKNGKDGYCMEGMCATTCTSDSDCTDATKPFCSDSDNGICVACTQNSHCGDTTSDYCSAGVCNTCSGTTPYWNTESAKCAACAEDSHCTDETKPFCNNGTCGVCLEDSHCTDETKPFCSNGTCVRCTQDSHCGDTVSDYCSYGSCNTCSTYYPYRDTEKKTCEECLENSHCTDATEPFCNNGTCSCTDDSQCLDETIPYCVNRKCVACTSHSQCGAKQYCGDSNASCEKAQLGGACHDLDYTAHTITYTDTSGVSKTETFYVFKKPMTWWDTVSACKALGNKDLLSVTDLITKEDGSPWQGDTGTHTRTDLAQKLDNKVPKTFLGNNYILTSNSKSSCSVYTVRLVDGYVSYTGRNRAADLISIDYYPVCR